ncbi:hypothetical protein EZS27_030714 [termite gut metagenome]|uniref:Uncharacterized protein n=1 Tax=termite gut metagenome TaxID=433724 RepID=A0A5J4QBM9_9ZZZZ
MKTLFFNSIAESPVNAGFCLPQGSGRSATLPEPSAALSGTSESVAEPSILPAGTSASLLEPSARVAETPESSAEPSASPAGEIATTNRSNLFIYSLISVPLKLGRY